MIHRALFGSVERFFGILLEHYAGAFPAWLAPVQARVLPVRDDHEAYAAAGRRPAAGARASGPTWSRPTSRSAARIRRGQAGEAALRAGGGRRRRGRRHGRRQRPGRRGRAGRARRRLRRAPARPRSPTHRLTRDARAAVGGLAERVRRAGRRRRRRTATAACSAGSWPATSPTRRPTSCWRDDRCCAVLNAYPYTSGHLLVMPVRHVAELEDLDADEAAELWAARRRRGAARSRRPTGPTGVNVGRQPGPGGRRRRARPPPRPLRAPLGRRHQLHDHRGRGPGPARGPPRHLRQAAGRVAGTMKKVSGSRPDGEGTGTCLARSADGLIAGVKGKGRMSSPLMRSFSSPGGGARRVMVRPTLGRDHAVGARVAGIAEAVAVRVFLAGVGFVGAVVGGRAARRRRPRRRRCTAAWWWRAGRRRRGGRAGRGVVAVTSSSRGRRRGGRRRGGVVVVDEVVEVVVVDEVVEVVVVDDVVVVTSRVVVVVEVVVGRGGGRGRGVVVVVVEVVVEVVVVTRRVVRRRGRGRRGGRRRGRWWWSRTPLTSCSVSKTLPCCRSPRGQRDVVR